jgi:hypothetical protein
VIDEIDYMTINKIGGDPEKKHNIRWARKLGITDTPDKHYLGGEPTFAS